MKKGMFTQMKRFKEISMIIIVLILTLTSTAGCSKEQKIEKELNGTWSYQVNSIDGPCFQSYTFKDGTFGGSWVNVNAPSKSSFDNGTYEITDSEIILTNIDGDIVTIIEYTFVSGDLKLIDLYADRSGSRTLEKE